VTAAIVAHVVLQRSTDRDTPSVAIALLGVATVALLGSVMTILVYVLGLLSGDPTRASGTIDASLAVDDAVVIGALLLLVGVVVSRLGDRFRIPGSLALLGLGMVVGSDGLGWILVDDPVAVQGVAVLALIVILYQGGLTTRPGSLRGAVVPGVLLASAGVLVTAVVVAGLGIALLGLPRQLAWLLAAVVAPTDAAAVFAILRRTPLPPRLAAILQVESGANDPIAVLLTVAVLTAGEVGGGAATWLEFGVAQIGLGAALGIGIGFVAAQLLSRLHRDSDHLLPTMALAIGGLAYGATALVGGSGFLAVYLCGVTLAARTPGARKALRSFHGALADSVEVGLFLLLGLLIFPAGLPAVLGVGLAVTALLLLVARPLATAISLAPFGFRLPEVAVVSWLGMRGAVPIVLATVAFSAGYAEADELLNIVFVVVLAATLVQGVTASWAVDRLGLKGPPAPTATVIEHSPYEGIEGQLLDITLGDDSQLVGRALAASSPPPGTLVTAIIRRDRLLVPRGPTVLRIGDHLLVAAETARSSRAAAGWATGVPSDRGRLTERRRRQSESGIE
jgi:cell volume regulation protein A